jgi:hypothetical protein
MRRAVLWDSSATLALLDASDGDHAGAAAFGFDRPWYRSTEEEGNGPVLVMTIDNSRSVPFKCL